MKAVLVKLRAGNTVERSKHPKGQSFGIGILES